MGSGAAMVYRPYEAGDGDPNYDTINLDRF
jgi:hypothetical protein